MVPHADFVFLGLCTVDIQKALLDDGAIWIRIEEQIDIRSTSQTNLSLDLPSTTDRSMEHLNRSHRGEHMRSSSSDDVDSIGDASSLLHPNHAWTTGSRRGSSQSEQYISVGGEQHLGKDYSHSLPGSRRSSFQDSQGNCDNSDSSIFNSLCLTGRRRSSCTRRDQHDDLTKTSKGSRTKLNRTLSASASEKRLSKSK